MVIFKCLFVLFFFLSDQLIKLKIVNNFDYGEEINIIDNIISLTFIKNTGAAWSILENQTLFLIIFSTPIIVGIIVLLIKTSRSKFVRGLGLSVMLAGALGNYFDRIRLGYVIDMIKLDFYQFPIFNFADVYLFVGLIITLFSYSHFQLKRTRSI
ncbi:signal peptidase II [Enterococcus casseliflavus]|uniref:signal peptidase II n=1 Tax=Enterococcus casseliflavus TaxID=37734 RepID=UPI0039A76974